MDTSTGQNAKRNTWEFLYNASIILAGADRKKDFHTERLDFWNSKKQEVINTIKADGIDFEESISNMVSNSYRPTGVTVRDDLMRDLNECNQRVSVHKMKIEGYNAWIEILASQGETMLPLTQDDWLYFFSKVT